MDWKKIAKSSVLKKNDPTLLWNQDYFIRKEHPERKELYDHLDDVTEELDSEKWDLEDDDYDWEAHLDDPLIPYKKDALTPSQGMLDKFNEAVHGGTSFCDVPWTLKLYSGELPDVESPISADLCLATGVVKFYPASDGTIKSQEITLDVVKTGEATFGRLSVSHTAYVQGTVKECGGSLLSLRSPKLNKYDTVKITEYTMSVT